MEPTATGCWLMHVYQWLLAYWSGMSIFGGRTLPDTRCHRMSGSLMPPCAVVSSQEACCWRWDARLDGLIQQGFSFAFSHSSYLSQRRSNKADVQTLFLHTFHLSTMEPWLWSPAWCVIWRERLTCPAPIEQRRQIKHTFLNAAQEKSKGSNCKFGDKCLLRDCTIINDLLPAVQC